MFIKPLSPPTSPFQYNRIIVTDYFRFWNMKILHSLWERVRKNFCVVDLLHRLWKGHDLLFLSISSAAWKLVRTHSWWLQEEVKRSTTTNNKSLTKKKKKELMVVTWSRRISSPRLSAPDWRFFSPGELISDLRPPLWGCKWEIKQCTLVVTEDHFWYRRRRTMSYLEISRFSSSDIFWSAGSRAIMSICRFSWKGEVSGSSRGLCVHLLRPSTSPEE